MAKKMNRKTRNVISGILVGLASIFAVINFAEVPAEEVRDFLLSTALFFIAIVVLAFVAVSVFKLLGWLGKAALGDQEEHQDSGQDVDDRE